MNDEKQSSRLLTLVFTDVLDSTALKSRDGDIRAGAMLARYRGEVEGLAREHGGRIIDWAGDGCFLTFETSSEAVLFAAGLQRGHLDDPGMPAIRIGIHMGEVTEFTRPDGTVRVEGLSVDLTARLESLAHPNQILMSEAVYHSARQRLRHREGDVPLRWKSHGAYRVKGFDEPIEACVVGHGEDAPMAAPVRSEKAWPVEGASRREGISEGGSGTTLDDLRLLLRLFRRPRGMLAVGALVVTLGLGVFYVPSVQRNRMEANAKWARDVIPVVQAHMEAGDFEEAYGLAVEANEYIDDMLLDQLIAQSSGELRFATNVPGARVMYKPYDKPDSAWREAGETPMESLVLPAGIYRWRVELDGYAAREFGRAVYPQGQGVFGDLDLADYDLTLMPESPATKGMTFVDGGPFLPSITGLSMVQHMIDPFFIDKTEVTNGAYREFVKAGGYGEPSYWEEAFALAGVEAPFEDVMERFVDSTGRPGPATWIMGDVPAGKDNYPVQGVSWFEAMAYAEFRGQMLPTVYHWARAAFPEIEVVALATTPLMLGYSNLEGDGPIPVASTPDMSSAGAYNMAGNVREWCVNERGGMRFIMGGKWDEPQYTIFTPTPINPWDRSEGNGFRCMLIPDGAAIQKEFLEPLGDYVFEANLDRYTRDQLRSMTALLRVAPRSDYLERVESRDDSHRHFDREEVTIAGPGTTGDRLPLILQKPKTGEGRWPAVVFLPGLDALYLTNPDEGLAAMSQFIPQIGRVLVRPVLSGMYHRNEGNSAQQFNDPEQLPAILRTWIQELNHTVAYLKTRPDVDAEAITLYGISLGAIVSIPVGATNDDVKALVLALGGLPALGARENQRRPLLIEEFATLVQQPVLMLNGRYDFLFPVEESQKPLFERFAVDPAHKRLKLYDQGHTMPAQAEVVREMLAWLDRYERGIPETPEVAGAVDDD